GCTSLSEFSLPDEIESIGDNAFDGIPALKSIAPTKKIANIVANSNAKNITLDISKIEADDFSDMSFDIGEINSFKLLGGYKEYKGLNINSDASTTILSGITIPESNVTPIELSSSNVTLERVSIHSDTFCLILKADTTKISIEGISNIISESGDGILSKNIEFSLINEETDSAIDTDSNVMVCGTVSNNDDYLNENHIIYITEDEYTNYLTQRKVTFDANGGVLGTETNYVIVPYNGVIGEFPVASRDYYTFDGWYTEAEGGEAVTSETNISSDTTFYAHWVHNDAVWALASEAPEDAEIVNKKYKYTLTSYTTSSSSSLSGWEKYDVKWKWSSYGSWSSWSTKAVTETDAKDVETKSVVSGYKKKTQWLYSRARSPRGSVAYGWVSGDCTVVEGTGWLDSPLEHQATHSCGNAYGKGFRNEDGVVYSGIYWYNETTQTVDDLNSPIYQTQYRYRTRSKVYTYYYEKDETKESATYPTAPSGCDISNIQEWVQYRAK
ncbi:MAG: InlB B-repeat-containing protein, partial [Clostridia bacterium]|nr:InlB B-repeat-containing protein [Clostridia bacterium]